MFHIASLTKHERNENDNFNDDALTGVTDRFENLQLGQLRSVGPLR
jgi:hypothetical protein